MFLFLCLRLFSLPQIWAPCLFHQRFLNFYVLRFVFSATPTVAPMSASPTHTLQLSPKLVTVQNQFSPTQPAATNTFSWNWVIAFLNERFTRREKKRFELDKAFVAREYPVLKLYLSLSTAASSKATLCSRVSTLQIDLTNARAELSAALSSMILAASDLNQLCTRNNHMESRVTVLSSTLKNVRLKLATTQSSVSSAAFESSCFEQDRHLAFFRISVYPFVCVDSDFVILFASTQDSLSTLHHGLVLIF